jgi:hypothetical protein
MGLLVEGKWTDQWYDSESTGGRFVRKESPFRQWVRADGSTPFLPEPGRYHLLRLACLSVGAPDVGLAKAQGARRRGMDRARERFPRPLSSPR